MRRASAWSEGVYRATIVKKDLLTSMRTTQTQIHHLSAVKIAPHSTSSTHTLAKRDSMTIIRKSRLFWRSQIIRASIQANPSRPNSCQVNYLTRTLLPLHSRTLRVTVRDRALCSVKTPIYNPSHYLRRYQQLQTMAIVIASVPGSKSKLRPREICAPCHSRVIRTKLYLLGKMRRKRRWRRRIMCTRITHRCEEMKCRVTTITTILMTYIMRHRRYSK